MKYKIMKFAANKTLEGKEIELERVKVSSSDNSGKTTKRKTIHQILEEIQQTLNLHTQLFIEHGWLKLDPKTGQLVKNNK